MLCERILAYKTSLGVRNKKKLGVETRPVFVYYFQCWGTQGCDNDFTLRNPKMTVDNIPTLEKIMKLSFGWTI